MLEPHPDLTLDVIHGLGSIWLILAAMNFAWAVHVFRKGSHFRTGLGGHSERTRRTCRCGPLALYATLLVLIGLAHVGRHGDPESFKIRLPSGIKMCVDYGRGQPRIYFCVSIVGFGLFVILRRLLVQPMVAWALLNLVAGGHGPGLTDPNFRRSSPSPTTCRSVVLFIVGFFTWLATSRAVENDERIAQGLPAAGEQNNEKVLVWPDLVYTEMICMVALTALLWSGASPCRRRWKSRPAACKTPNPSKAPWYFLGLQEMLVYYDPWMAGVVLPSLIIVGLMAIPFLDFNSRGTAITRSTSGSSAILIFPFGFLAVGDADHPGHVLPRAELEHLRPLRVLGRPQGAGAEQRRPVAIVLDQLAGHVAAGARRPEPSNCVKVGIHLLREWLGHRAGAGLLLLLPPLMAPSRLPQVLREDGLHPLHGDGQPAAVHGGPADQDGAALDVQPEIHHRHSGVVF